MAGLQGAPTPWWQLPGNGAAASNLETSAPPGYTYDKVKMQYVPTFASAPSQNNLFGSLTGAVNGLSAGASAGATGVSGSAPPTSAPSAGTPGIPSQISFGGTGSGSIAAPNIKPAQDAAFARAKDMAGNTARASISSLNDEMAGRGVLNSGTTNRGLVDRLSSATNTLGGVESAQLGDAYGAAQHTQDLENENTKTAYQGGITQRGQDLAAQDAAAKNTLAATSLAQQKALATQAMLANVLGSFKLSF